MESFMFATILKFFCSRKSVAGPDRSACSLYPVVVRNYCLTSVLIILCSFMATKNEAQLVNEVDAVSSEVEDYLKKVCNGSATCHLVSRLPRNYRNLGVRNCMCDDQCPNYEDCCEDAPYKNSPKRENTTFECLETAVDGHVYMVTTCAPPSKSSYDSLVAEMCGERHPGLLAVDIVLSTPVTNTYTGKTYRNVYCALCNDDEEFEAWSILVSYDGLLRALENGTTTTTSLRSADDIANISIRPDDHDYYCRFKNQNTSLDDQMKCYLNATIPRGLSGVVRPCVPNVIKACASDWIDRPLESVSRKCVDNDLAYISVDDKIYKNEFCAECNNVSLNSAKVCTGTITPKSNATSYQPFVLNITDKRVPKVPKSCSAIRRPVATRKLCRTPSAEETSREGHYFGCFPTRKDTRRPCLMALDNIPRNSGELKFTDNERYVIYRDAKYKFEEEFFNGTQKGTVYVCGSSYVDENRKGILYMLDGILTWILTKLSVIGLVLHLLVFQRLPQIRNLSGKNLACFSLTLMIFYISLDLAQPVRGWTGSCRALGVLIHYTLLSCSAWILIMSYDCWLTFYRASTQFHRSTGKRHSVRFAIYCLLGWSAPLLPVGYGVYLEYLSTEPYNCRPGYGLSDNCLMYNGRVLNYLLFIPSCAGFVGSSLFFAHTGYTIYANQRETGNPKARNNFKLYKRLALVMGLTWTLFLLVRLTRSKIFSLMFTSVYTSHGIFLFFGFTLKILIKHVGGL